jgi:hypothetical protein
MTMLTKPDYLSLLKKAIAANLRARAEHAARRVPREGNSGTRLDIIDKCWDGIGRKGDIWVS